MTTTSTRTVVTLTVLSVVVLIFASSSKPLEDKPSKRDKTKRFDYLVRADMLNGFGGDTAALERAVKTCEDTLRANPNHPEALVWHGSAVWFKSGQAFQRGDFQTGMKLSDSGMSQMDRAVDLAPDNAAVRIPRGAIILGAAPFMPEPSATALMKKGVADYEKALEIQTPYFSKMPVHSRGELLGGMADTYRRLGEIEKARTYFKRITEDIPGSEYAKLSTQWLKVKDMGSKDIKLQPVTCIGCHTEG